MQFKIMFTVPGAPMGKPRMTRQDKWKKRKAVVKYREYSDRIRHAFLSTNLPKDFQPTNKELATCGDDFLNGWKNYAVRLPVPERLDFYAFIGMPKSWSKKKKREYYGMIHQSKPDCSNMTKGIEDSLCPEDSAIAAGYQEKRWVTEEEQQTLIILYYGFYRTSKVVDIPGLEWVPNGGSQQLPECVREGCGLLTEVT